MKCSNCGKAIPFSGDVCPFCHVDKSPDQVIQICGFIGGLIGCGFGYLIGQVCGLFGGMVFGAIVGVIVGYAANNANKKKTGRTRMLPNLAATLQQTTVKVAAMPPPLGTASGEGHYQVAGVDRETKMDTVWHTHAASAANAKVKGELQGIIVTEVTKVA
jgi:hypothetical protein